jgi:hypothetical protein
MPGNDRKRELLRAPERGVTIPTAKFQMSKSKFQTNSKYLNVKPTLFCHLDFKFDLTFELCHLILLGI